MEKKTIQWKSSSESIKGYAESAIAKSEKNDCVVRALASASELEYDKAHKFVKKEFGRKNRSGTFWFNSTMSGLQKANRKLNRKTIQKVPREFLVGKNRMTVGKFIQNWDRGSYVLTVSGHALAIKDGVVLTGIMDARKVKRPIESAWKIGK